MTTPIEATNLDEALLHALQDVSSLNRAWLDTPYHILQIPGEPDEMYMAALRMVAAVIYQRPDLIDGTAATAIGGYLGRPDLTQTAVQHATDVLSFLLATPAQPDAIQTLVELLSSAHHSDVLYTNLLPMLGQVVEWTPESIPISQLLALAQGPQLVPYRDELLPVVERRLLSTPGEVREGHIEDLVAVWGRTSARYCLGWLAQHHGVAPHVRESAAAAVAGLFPLGPVVYPRAGKHRALVVQNIADKQGDEIIRVAALLQALLDSNPEMEVTLLTSRPYLYAHPRLTLVPIADRTSAGRWLQDRYDVVVDFFEPEVTTQNHDLELERAIRAHVAAYPPAILLRSFKGYNHFLFEQVDVSGSAYAVPLQLHRQRVPNIYESTSRLLLELGLPCRQGESQPRGEPVLAGLPCPDARQMWADLTRGNVEQRPVALLNAFGGAERLKGYTRPAGLAERIHLLVREGFFVVALPNGMPWGTAGTLREAVSLLPPDAQAWVAIAADPPGSGPVTYDSPNRITVPALSYWMHQVIEFLRFTDTVATVEGWMMHAAYVMGRPYRVLMLPYSHLADWHPYARSSRQGSVQLFPPVGPPLGSDPPLPEQPRKQVLLFLAEGMGAHHQPGAVRFLRHVARSDDRDLRQVAVAALGKQRDSSVDGDLVSALGDPCYQVRGAAAQALLVRRIPGIDRSYLLAHVRIAAEPRDWRKVVSLGPAVLEVLKQATQDENGVIQREARGALMAISPPARPARRETPANPRKPSSNTKLLRKKENSSTEPRVVIVTPLKDAADCLDMYRRGLESLTFPHHLISLGFLESDSQDDTFDRLQAILPRLNRQFRRARAWKRDFGYRIPPGIDRWTPAIQAQRRSVLARSRNHLLLRALDDEGWVLWLDVDVIRYPPNILQQLLATGRDIVQPHCVLDPGGPTFDYNAWQDRGRRTLSDLRGTGDLVELDAVGGTMLLVRADAHRDGLIFPPVPYGRGDARAQHEEGELETEGLGLLAQDMGYQCWGMPDVEIIHRRA